MAYLVQHGVDPSRLTAQGYGETRPIESNRTSQGRDINRRVELVRTDTAH
jgi:OOP family OmpA-OmpF porin